MIPDRIQTKHDIQKTLAATGLRPDKRFGQHFLIDGNLMRKLLGAAEIDAADTVLEVGGGTGGLSDMLAGACRRLIVVEIDRRLAGLLSERFADLDHVTVVHADVLSRKHTLNPSVVDPLRESPGSAGRCILVANLPYNAATPLIMNLLASEPQVKRLCFTVQKEVGDRMTASVGTKAFGPLAIAVQTTCDLRRIARVPATAFWPAPNVESVMLRLDRKRHPFENGDTLSDFLELVHAAFAHRRKTLRFNLERSLDEAALATAAGLLDMSKRAETVSVRSWIEVGVTLVGGSGVD